MLSIHQIHWLNKNIDIVSKLEELGINIPANNKVFCPFHYNVNTPSAKLYLNESNVGSLYCYAEQKHYSVYDVMKLLGYTDERMKAMVPREYWYAGDLDDEKPLKIPVVAPDFIQGFGGRVFELLDRLDYMWDNPNQFRCFNL